MLPDEDLTGFASGLRENIDLRIGKIRVLVMDNHNAAAAFLAEMQKEGVLQKGSSMIHIDDHADLDMPPRLAFDPGRFTGMRSQM